MSDVSGAETVIETNEPAELPVDPPPPKEKNDPFAGFAQAAPEAKEDPFANFEPAEPSFEDKALAFAQSASGAAVETTPMIGGAILGGQLGTPSGPFGVAGGAILGGAAGFFAGQLSREALARLPLPSGKGKVVVRNVDELPPDLRPFGFAGEVIGSGVGFAGAPLALAGTRLPPSRVGNFLNRILETAGRSPGTFAAVEASGLTGGALGAGVAETFRPGEAPTRVAAEIAGGFMNPTRLLAATQRATMDVFGRVSQSLSAGARETKAGQVLRGLAEEAGEDPDAIVELLRQSGIPGVEVTAAQKTGSPALITLESKLRQRSAKFGADAAKMADDALATIKNMMVVLRGTGDPQAFAAAADLRGQYFRTLLASRVQEAEEAAMLAAEKLIKDSPSDRARLGRVAQEAIANALADARRAESELWDAIPKDTPANADNIVEAVNDIRNRLLPEQSLPPIVEGFVSRVTKKGVNEPQTNVNELLLLRSNALEEAREMSAAGKFRAASQLGAVAEAALEDLSALPLGKTVDDARAFSRELHDTFTRTFAGQASRTARTGANRIPPELLLRRTLSGGGEATALRMQEMRDATEFMIKRGLDTPEAAQGFEVMLDVQSRILRLAAAESINPSTGNVNSGRLSRFLRDNEELLNRFPEVKTDINRALQSTDNLQRVQVFSQRGIRAIEQRAAFARAAKFENPIDAVNSAINGREPVRDLLGMVKLAKRAGFEAEEGLKAAVWDHVFRKAGDDFSFPKLKKALLDPIRPDQPSVADLMQRAGIMTQKDLNQAKRLLDTAENISNAVQRGTSVDDLIAEPDAMLDLVLRIAGAKLGAASLSGTASGATLVAAGAGSRFLRSTFDRIPRARVGAVLVEAAKDPEFAALLMKKTKTQGQKITLGRQIHAYILQAGLTSDDEDE